MIYYGMPEFRPNFLGDDRDFMVDVNKKNVGSLYYDLLLAFRSEEEINRLQFFDSLHLCSGMGLSESQLADLLGIPVDRRHHVDYQYPPKYWDPPRGKLHPADIFTFLGGDWMNDVSPRSVGLATLIGAEYLFTYGQEQRWANAITNLKQILIPGGYLIIHSAGSSHSLIDYFVRDQKGISIGDCTGIYTFPESQMLL